MDFSRFINLAGSTFVRRPRPAQQYSVQNEEATDPQAVAEHLRKVLKRVADLERTAYRAWIEFELNVDNGGVTTYRLEHRFGCPVRYWVTYWNHPSTSATDPTAGPCLIASDTSTTDVLVLTSKVTGRAVVRVEPADYPLTPGP